jgi:hypothetical protein
LGGSHEKKIHRSILLGKQMLNKQLDQKIMNGEHCDRKSMGFVAKEVQFG